MSKKLTNHWVIMGLVVLVVGVSFWLGLQSRRPPYEQLILQEENPISPMQEISLGGNPLKVEIRDTAASRALGLSFREGLGPEEGMLFVFEDPEQPLFWMRGMNFDIDIIFIRDLAVVQIEKGVPAPANNRGQIATVRPALSVNMVLEVSSGWAEAQGIRLGDKIEGLEK
jgi:uncharacterized protein